MIVSIEPGYYEVQNFGIRLENLYYIEKLSSSTNIFYNFKQLTYVPFQKNMIDIKLLNEEQINWINSYHQEINTKMKDFIQNNEIKEWLNEICQKLEK